jgi:hypothetical protein
MLVRTVGTVLVSGLALCLTSCSSKPADVTQAHVDPGQPTQAAARPPRQALPAKEEIIGKWQSTDKNNWFLTVEKNGKITYGEPGAEFVAPKYTFVDDNTMEFEAKAPFGSPQFTKWVLTAQPDKVTCKIVESKTRDTVLDSLAETDNDRARVGTEEHYKRVN